MTAGNTASRARLPDGRWHFQHGPIDCILGANGDPVAIDAAIEGAWRRFECILAELVSELRILKAPIGAIGVRSEFGLIEFCSDPNCSSAGNSYSDPNYPNYPKGPIAQRMVAACLPYAREGLFITPMAAVAGSVAEELIGLFHREGITRAYVNNGGDIAIHLTPGTCFDVGLVANVDRPRLNGSIRVTSDMPIRGIATSGWRGRSLSLGIADSATVLARTASAADAAASIVANHVDVDHPAIARRPAREVRDNSDLLDVPVTVAVGPLPRAAVELALAAGADRARREIGEGRIEAAALALAGQLRLVGEVAHNRGRSERIAA